jgi:hypothetical protein
MDIYIKTTMYVRQIGDEFLLEKTFPRELLYKTCRKNSWFC